MVAFFDSMMDLSRSIPMENGCLSRSVVDAMIRVWRIARLSTDSECLSYPSISILGRCVEQGGTDGFYQGYRGSVPTSQGITDAERVQSIVDRMPDEMREVFEAYHLGIIRSQKWQKPHRERAIKLGIPWTTYRYRRDAGYKFVQDLLHIVLDRPAQIAQNIPSWQS